jgi:hypothetical protein
MLGAYCRRQSCAAVGCIAGEVGAGLPVAIATARLGQFPLICYGRSRSPELEGNGWLENDTGVTAFLYRAPGRCSHYRGGLLF